MKPTLNESGQSVLEIVFLMPFLFAFVIFLYKMNMTAQMSINNAQFARSQLYILSSNSPEYPRLEFRTLSGNSFVKQKQDMMLIGVSDPSAINQANANNQTIDPIPQTQKVARTGITGSSAPGEVAQRSEIRVRNTATICTQTNLSPESTVGIATMRWPFGQVSCRYEGVL